MANKKDLLLWVAVSAIAFTATTSNADDKLSYWGQFFLSGSVDTRNQEIDGRGTDEVPVGTVKSTHDLNSGTDVGRARFGLTYQVSDKLSYNFDYEFTGNSLKDAYLTYQVNNQLSINIGQQFFAINQEEAKSSFNYNFSGTNATSNYGYSLIDALPGMVNGYDKSITALFDAGMFAGGLMVREVSNEAGVLVDDSGDTSEHSVNTKNNAGYGVAARLTVAPVNTSQQTLHIGIAGSRTDYNKNLAEDLLHIDAQDKNSLGVRSSDLAVVEAAYGYGSFHIDGTYATQKTKYQVYRETEYFRTPATGSISSDTDGAEVALGGTAKNEAWYVETSLFLTGETVSYDKGWGNFGGTKAILNPVGKGGSGAFQLAARYSHSTTNEFDAILFNSKAALLDK